MAGSEDQVRLVIDGVGPQRDMSVFKRGRPDAGLLASVVLLLVLVGCSLFAGILPMPDPAQQSLPLRLSAPALDQGHLLGTDQLGRDVLSRIVYGARVSLIVAAASVLIAGTVGVLLGAVAGYYGGWIDDVVSWLINVFLAFPFVLLALAVVAILGPGLINIIIVLGLTSWVAYARVIRSQVLSLRERDFIQAVRALGGRDDRIVLRHIIPNTLAPLIVIATFEMARMIIMESALSFLGLGVEPSLPSWGNMLADGRSYLAIAWWIATFPGFAIMLTVLSINILGDWLRTQFDPKAARM
ncbi:MAG: ABC transporter permease [Trueperaceae bacterium]